MRATVIGLGHIGLVTALGLAKYGNDIIGYDHNPKIRDRLQNVDLWYVEEHVQDALKAYLNNGFTVANTIEESINASTCFLFCVETPASESGRINVDMLEKAMREVYQKLTAEGHYVFVVRSTVFPGVVRQRIAPFLRIRESEGIVVHIVSNPEFLRESTAWKDFCEAERTLIGTDGEWEGHIVAKLYQELPSKKYFVSPETADFAKYLSNCMLATMISFSNEMSLAAQYIGNISVSEAFNFVQNDERWNRGEMSNYIYPGCGYGGSCLPKDTVALLSGVNDLGFIMPILTATIQDNENMPYYIAKGIMNNVERTKVIGIMGLSYKPGSDDVRESSASKLIPILKQYGYNKILCFDYIATSAFSATYPELSLKYTDSLERFIEEADVLINLHADIRFKNIRMAARKKLLDFRYICSEED